MTLYCATTNAGKLREFALAAKTYGVSIDVLPGLRDLPPAPETGDTFEANAIQKALYYGAHTAGLVFVDDSGLEVDALGGEPGVLSARYAGESATDAANNALLLERLAATPNRTARFVCVVALAQAGQLVGTWRGTVEGHILTAPRGAGGFGYDPLFWYEPFGLTLAEVDAERKLAVSHRGQALRAMLESLRRQQTSSGSVTH